MAYIWHGVASFPNEGLAKAFTEHFDRTEFTLPHTGRCELHLGVEHNGSGWEVCIAPYVAEMTLEEKEPGAPPDRWHLNDHGGANTPEEVEDIDVCAKVIYERLSTVISRAYEFALTGFEVGDWRSPDELAKDLAPGGLYREHILKFPAMRAWDGLVVSQKMWEAAERPDGFVRFAADHFWIPFHTIENAQ